MRSYVNIFTGLIILYMSSCKDSATNSGNAGHPKIYFESEYINHAWGYAHHGWFIDTLGKIISYDIAKSDTQWIPNSNRYYLENEIWTKIHHCDTIRGFVPTDTLRMLNGWALASIAGSYSDTTYPARDMGTYVYSFYIYLPDSSKFRQFILRVDGDCRYYNTLESAIALSNWMSHR